MKKVKDEASSFTFASDCSLLNSFPSIVPVYVNAFLYSAEAAIGGVYKKGVLKNFAKFTGKHQCWSLFINKLHCQGFFIKRETPTQVLSCEVCNNKNNKK